MSKKRRESYLELVSNQVDLVHHSVRCRNVLLLLSDRPFHLFHGSHCFLGAKNHIASPEVSVENPENKPPLLNRLLQSYPEVISIWRILPVGETFPADTDSLKHTVASELVHH